MNLSYKWIGASHAGTNATETSNLSKQQRQSLTPRLRADLPSEVQILDGASSIVRFVMIFFGAMSKYPCMYSQNNALRRVQTILNYILGTELKDSKIRNSKELGGLQRTKVLKWRRYPINPSPWTLIVFSYMFRQGVQKDSTYCFTMTAVHRFMGQAIAIRLRALKERTQKKHIQIIGYLFFSKASKSGVKSYYDSKELKKIEKAFSKLHQIDSAGDWDLSWWKLALQHLLGNEGARPAYKSYWKLPMYVDVFSSVLDVIRLEAMMTASINALQNTAHELIMRNQD